LGNCQQAGQVSRPKFAKGLRELLGGSLEDLDRTLDGTQFTLGETLKPERQTGAGLGLIGQFLASLLRQAKGKAAPIDRVLGSLDKAGAHQRVHRPAYGGRTATDG